MARTKPIGVRFDPDKLEFVKGREKLSSNQQVVDLLINKYWWEHKMPHVTAKEAPPLTLKSETAVMPPPHPKAPTTAPKSFLQYQSEKRELECDEDYQKWLTAVQGDPLLSTKQKDLLIKYS